MSAGGRRGFLRGAAAGAAALAVFAVEGLAWAAEVDVSVSLGRSQLEVGRSAYIQIKVSSSRGGQVSKPKIAGAEGLDLVEQGSASGRSVVILNGRQTVSSTMTYTYVVTPREAGEYSLDISVEVNGKTYRPAAKPKLIATGEGYVPVVEEGKAGDKPTDPSAELIVWPVVDKAEAYVGEQIIYQLQFWRRIRPRGQLVGLPTFKDFWSEDLQIRPDEEVRRDMIANVPYDVELVFHRALFPQRAGTLTIGGAEYRGQAFPGAFFGRSTPPQSYYGRTLAIEVKPLPAAGQPPGFRASNVGQLKISTAVDRSELGQGEAARLTVVISGVANIPLVELPELPEMPGLRTYEPKPGPPKLRTNGARLEGSREFTMLVVADEAGALEIPAFELPYFDPAAEAYRVAKSEPIALSVEANPNARPSADAGGPTQADAGEGSEDNDDDELLAPVFASAELTRVTPRERWLTSERWWAGALAAPALLGLGALGLRLRERFGPDDASKARAAELGRRKQLLTEARALLDGGEGFYPKLATLLQGAAVGRAGPRGVGLTRARLLDLLAEQGLARDELDELRELLDACDAARFGAGSGDVDQRRQHLERAQALLAKRSWRPS